MTDIVERKKPVITEFGPGHGEVQEIERLRERVKELETALKPLAECHLSPAVAPKPDETKWCNWRSPLERKNDD